MALFRVERNEMRINHRFVSMDVADRACRTGMVWSRRCAPVARCVGPVLTEPVSGAVPSHFPGVLVAVAEDSRLIALWASAHCYESNPYWLSSCQSADTALDYSLAFECTQHGYQLVLCHLCHTALLVNPCRLVGSASPSGSQPGAAAPVFSGHPARGAPAIFPMVYCHLLPSSLVQCRSQLAQVRRPPILIQCWAMDLRHFSAFELAPSLGHLFLSQE
jgi:hypothetical protein